MELGIRSLMCGLQNFRYFNFFSNYFSRLLLFFIMENQQTCCLLIYCDVYCREKLQGKVSFTANNFILSGDPLSDYQYVKEIAKIHVDTLPDYWNPEVSVTNIINLTQIFK